MSSASHLLPFPFLGCAHAHIIPGASEPWELNWLFFKGRKRCLHYFILLYVTRNAWSTTRKSLLWPAWYLLHLPTHKFLMKSHSLMSPDNKSDVKSRNTIPCLYQFMAQNSKYTGGECPPSPINGGECTQNAGKCPHPLKRQASSERIGISQRWSLVN